MRSIGSSIHELSSRLNVGIFRTSAISVATGAAFLVGLATPLASQALTVSANVTSNAVWSRSQSPIIVQGDVAVDQDATLTVEPGVEIRMERAASFTVRRGAVRAVGTQSQPIVITSSKATPAAGDWGVWRFGEGTRSAETQFDYVRIEYGTGVVIEKASPTLNRVAIRHHTGPAMRMDLESSPVGSGLVAEGNTLNAIAIPAGVISGQVSWALVGIPYFIEQGLVEVGGSQVSIDPAEVRLATNATWPMRLLLKNPVPAGGRVVTFTSSAPQTAYVYGNLEMPEGALEGRFDVNSIGTGEAVITASQSELGSATSKILVSSQSVLSLSPASSRMLVDSLYTVYVYLSTPAPSGGLTVQLAGQPAGALQHPASILIPAGQTQAEFTVRGNRPHTTGTLAAYAPTYFNRGAVNLNFTEQLWVGLDYVPNTIVVGAQQELDMMPVTPPAPRDGLRVQVTSSDTSVLTVTPAETVIQGEEMYPQTSPRVTFTGVSPGVARLQVTGNGVTGNPREIFVKKPTVLTLDAGTSSGRVTVGEGLMGKVRVGRVIDADSYYGSQDFWVYLRCEDASVCSAENIYIPSGSTSVEAEVTGLKTGSTRLIAEAQYTRSATTDVDVVKPGLVWTDGWGGPDEFPEQYLSGRHDFKVCFSVPAAQPYDRQRLYGSGQKALSVSFMDRSPAGLTAELYRASHEGVPVTGAFISSGDACTSQMYVGPASQRGTYRVEAAMVDGTTVRSDLIAVRADDQIELRPICGDCSEMVVLQGFWSKGYALARHMGGWAELTSPIQVSLRCSDERLCTTQASLEIQPESEDAFEIAGIGAGETSIEATVPALPDVYPEVGKASIRVVAPSLSFDSGSWENDFFEYSGSPQTYSHAICLSEPSWGVRSYSKSDMKAQVVSSNETIARFSEAEITWSAGEECIYVEVEYRAVGNVNLSFKVPGVPLHTKSLEVRAAQ